MAHTPVRVCQCVRSMVVYVNEKAIHIETWTDLFSAIVPTVNAKATG